MISKYLIIAAIIATAYLVLQPPIEHSEAFLLPIAYVFFELVAMLTGFKNHSKIFFGSLTTVSFFRYVIYPVNLSIAGYYVGRSPIEPTAESYSTAIYLMVYELLATSAIAGIVAKTIKPAGIKTPGATTFSPHLVIALMSVAVAGTLIVPTTLNYIGTIRAPSVEDEGGRLAALFANLLIVTKTLIMVRVLVFLRDNQHTLGAFALLTLVAMTVAISSSVYLGTHRIAVLIYTAGCIILCYQLYGRSIMTFVIPTSFAAAAFAFLAISSSRGLSLQIDDYDSTLDLLQVYLGGIYNVAIGIETATWFPEARNAETLFFDFARPMMGLNLFVAEWDIKYSNQFYNERMWPYIERRSQIIPMIGQGYFYFGPYLAPILTIVFLLIHYPINWLYQKTTSLELQFVLSLVLIRFGLMFGQNSMNLLNHASINLSILLLAVALDTVFKPRQPSGPHYFIDNRNL